MRPRPYSAAQAVTGGGLAALALSDLLGSGFAVTLWLLVVGGTGLAVTGSYYAVVGEFAGAEPAPVQYWTVLCCGLLVALGLVGSVVV